jgi:hypothetical protein
MYSSGLLVETKDEQTIKESCLSQSQNYWSQEFLAVIENIYVKSTSLSQITKDKWKKQSMNIICIGNMCRSRLLFLSDPFPYVSCVLHHVERLLPWHYCRTSSGVRGAVRRSSLLLGLFLLLLHQRTFQTSQVFQSLGFEMSWLRR